MFALCFLATFIGLSRPRMSRAGRRLLGFFAVFLVVYLMGFYNLDAPNGFGLFVKGMIKFAIQFSFLSFGVTWLWRRGQQLLLARAQLVLRRHRRQRHLRRAAAARRAQRRQPRRLPRPADHGWCEQDQSLRDRPGSRRLSRQRPHRRPEPPRDHADRAATRAHRRSTSGSSATIRSAGGSASRSRSCSSRRRRRSRAVACSG